MLGVTTLNRPASKKTLNINGVTVLAYEGFKVIQKRLWPRFWKKQYHCRFQFFSADVDFLLTSGTVLYKVKDTFLSWGEARRFGMEFEERILRSGVVHFPEELTGKLELPKLG